jgi:hypothetical protein
MSKLTERLRAYSQRRKIARGLDVEHIHTFDACPEGGINLLLSDVDGALDRIEHLERVLVQAREALKLAILQNSHDMQMTGQELRKCDFAVAAIDEALPPPTQAGSGAQPSGPGL